jgi:hypothetical protein
MLPCIFFEVGAKVIVLPFIINRIGSSETFRDIVAVVFPVRLKVPSAPVVVDKLETFIRLTFTPAIPAVPPVFLTMPFIDTGSAPSKHEKKRIAVTIEIIRFI